MTKFREKDKFICTKCGECCRRIKYLLPEYDRGDGVCCHLGEDNLCDIYESRSLICNVDLCWEKCLKGIISRKDWHELNYKYCSSKEIKEEGGGDI